MSAVRLTGRRVVLRPFKAAELDALVDEYHNASSDSGIVGRPSRAKLRRRIENSGRWNRGVIELAIEADGRMIGDVQARSHPRSLSPPGVVEIGITLFHSAERGRGRGTEALRLFTDWLLGPGEMARVQASTAVTNKAMRRVLEKLGYGREGVLHSFMPGPRGREDYVMYAKTKR